MSFKHVFITDALGSGGISTNIVALSRYVGSKKRDTLIVPISSKVYSRSVWGECANYSHIVSSYQLLKLLLADRQVKYIFFVNSIRSTLLAYTALLLSILKSHNIKIMFCVYHPNEFSKKDFLSDAYRGLLMTLGINNVLFMNQSCYREHLKFSPAEKFQEKYLPLVHSIIGGPANFLKNNDKNILTVARFTGFKMHYIRTLLNYAKQREDIKLNIVGDGEGFGEIEKYINENNIKNAEMIGRVDYDHLKSYYENCTCYVGMGTTLIEASATGKPSIVAIVGLPGDVCYGFFGYLKNYDVGEFNPTMEIKSMNQTIDSLFGMNEIEYNELGSIHLEKAKLFQIEEVGKLYLKYTEDADVNKINFSGLVKYIELICAGVAIYIINKIIKNKSRYDI